MISQVSSIVLFLSVFGLTLWEKNNYNRILTPFVVTSWPLAIISISVNFILVYIGFPQITLRVNLFILINLYVFWIVSFFLSKYVCFSRDYIDYKASFLPYKKYQYVLFLLSWAIIIITFRKVLSIVHAHGGWWFVGTDEFEKLMTVGFTAHAIMVGKICFILLFLIVSLSKQKLLIYITLLFLALSIFSIQVKYHLIWVILIVFYLKSGQQPTNIQLKKIINIGIIILILFVTYLFILSIGWQSIGLGNANLWEYFYKQFLNYVVSGPIILDNWLTQGGARPDWTLLIVFMNFLNVIMGNPERINAVPFVSTGFYETLPGYNSNVGTSFGVYYLIGGFWFTIVMTLLISILSHYLFFKSTMSKNPIVLFLNSLFLTLGSLSFFVQYFTSLTFYELPILFIIFISLFKLGNKIKVDIKI